jgi:hypothetical protein
LFGGRMNCFGLVRSSLINSRCAARHSLVRFQQLGMGSHKVWCGQT